MLLLWQQPDGSYLNLALLILRGFAHPKGLCASQGQQQLSACVQLQQCQGADLYL